MLDNSNWEISHDSGSFRDPCGQVFKITKDKESQIIRGIDLSTFNDQKELIKFKIGEELFVLIEPSVIPKNKAKKIVPSISPFANALIGFVGIILFMASNLRTNSRSCSTKVACYL